MPVGRPLKFKSVEELDSKIQAYFDSCDKDGTPYTFTGLSLALDTTRETLLDYEEKDQYSDSIKKAKLRCENYAETSLFNGKNVAGVIFNLKNNYKRWKDKTETDITSKGESISQSNPEMAAQFKDFLKEKK